MSRTMGRVMSESKPGWLASLTARKASSKSRGVMGGAGRRSRLKSAEGHSISRSATASTAPLAGAASTLVRCAGTRSIISRYRLGERYSRDRKSTRLNSSHANISYAVFCLKKKKKNTKVEVLLHTQLLND